MNGKAVCGKGTKIRKGQSKINRLFCQICDAACSGSNITHGKKILSGAIKIVGAMKTWLSGFFGSG